MPKRPTSTLSLACSSAQLSGAGYLAADSVLLVTPHPFLLPPAGIHLHCGKLCHIALDPSLLSSPTLLSSFPGPIIVRHRFLKGDQLCSLFALLPLIPFVSP